MKFADPAAAAGELLALVHEAWHEMDAHRGRCARMDATAAELLAALVKYSPTPPPPPTN